MTEDMREAVFISLRTAIERMRKLAGYNKIAISHQGCREMATETMEGNDKRLRWFTSNYDVNPRYPPYKPKCKIVDQGDFEEEAMRAMVWWEAHRGRMAASNIPIEDINPPGEGSTEA